jgi:hypothetical protein
MVSMPMDILAIPTIYGSSILPPTNGHGWEETTLFQVALITTAAPPGYRERWVRLPPEIFPRAAITPLDGPTAKAISGYMEGEGQR